MLIKTLTMLTMLTLVGCGGSGGDSDTPPLPETEVQTESEAEINVEAAPLLMSELFADPGFMFTSKSTVVVDLDLAAVLDAHNQTGNRAYVSIYPQYQQLPSMDYYPDTSSRILAGEVNNGVFKSEFINVNNAAVYLIEIWFYNGAPPIQQEKLLADNLLTW